MFVCVYVCVCVQIHTRIYVTCISCVCKHANIYGYAAKHLHLFEPSVSSQIFYIVHIGHKVRTGK